MPTDPPDPATHSDVALARAGDEPTADPLRPHRAPDSAEPTDDADGPRRFGNYELLQQLGKGGMGVVWKAKLVGSERLVALKQVLADEFTSHGAVERFKVEARAAAGLDHPGIVPVYEIGEVDGRPYYTMPVVKGGSLKTLLAGGPLPPAVAGLLVRQVAEAVAHAHEHGVIHRDLKPENILLQPVDSTPAGAANAAAERAAAVTPRLTDFGLARAADTGLESMTHTGSVLGTPPFMAPEQAAGDTRRVGPLSDVYGLGAVLYYCLTGRPPFQAATVLETLRQVQEQEPVSVRRLNPAVPRDLATVCLKCLHKDPARRYASAADLAEDLRRFQEGEPVRARPASARERAWKWAKRRPTRAALLVLSVVAACLALTGSWYHNRSLQAALDVARDAQARADASARRADANARTASEGRNLAVKALKGLVENVRVKLKSTPGTQAVRKSLLDSALAGFREIAASAQNSAPDLDRATAHWQLGQVFNELGRNEEAVTQLELARQVTKDWLAAAPHDLSGKKIRMSATITLGTVQLQLDKPVEATAVFSDALDVARAWHDADPTSTDARLALVQANARLGHAFLWRWDLKEAGVHLHEAEALGRSLVEDEPDSLRAREYLAFTYDRLVNLAKLSHSTADQRNYAFRMEKIQKDLMARAPENLDYKRNYSVLLQALANLARDAGNYADAGAYAETAERVVGEVASAEPEDVLAQCMVVNFLLFHASIEKDSGDYAAALARYTRGQDRLRQLDAAGKLKDLPYFRVEVPDSLAKQIELCAAMPRVLAEPDFAATQPFGLAAALLFERIRVLTAKHQVAKAAASARALCNLKTEGKDNYCHLAQTCAKCAALLPAEGPPSAPGRAARLLCTARALEALNAAEALGFNDVRRLENDPDWEPLRPLPEFKALLERLRKPPEQRPAGK